MHYQVSFSHDLEENLSIMEETGELDEAREDPRVFLELVTTRTLLARPVDDARSWFPDLERAVQADDGSENAVVSRLQAAVAAELLGLDSSAHLAVARRHVATMFRAVSDDPEARSQAVNQALGLSGLQAAADLESARNARFMVPGVRGQEAFDLELLTLSGRLLAGAAVEPDLLARELAYPAYAAATDAGLSTAPVLALMIASARRSGALPAELLARCLAAVDGDLFPSGPDQPARVRSSPPEWRAFLDPDSSPRLELRTRVTGTGGPLLEAAPLLSPLVCECIGRLSGLLSGDLAVGGDEGIESADLVRRVLDDPRGEVLATATTDEGLDIHRPAVDRCRERLDQGARWLRSRHPRLKAGVRLEVAPPG